MLIEDSSLDDIAAYFEDARIEIRIHNDGPTRPRSHGRPRQPTGSGSPPRGEELNWWVDLIGREGRPVWPHFGSGEDRESAIRSAAARWRIEQVGLDNQRRPGDPLP